MNKPDWAERLQRTFAKKFEEGIAFERKRILDILQAEQDRTKLGFIQYKVLIEKIQKQELHPPAHFRDIANGE